jgi:hypothetical protein
MKRLISEYHQSNLPTGFKSKNEIGQRIRRWNILITRKWRIKIKTNKYYYLLCRTRPAFKQINLAATMWIKLMKRRVRPVPMKKKSIHWCKKSFDFWKLGSITVSCSFLLSLHYEQRNFRLSNAHVTFYLSKFDYPYTPNWSLLSHKTNRNRYWIFVFDNHSIHYHSLIVLH